MKAIHSLVVLLFLMIPFRLEAYSSVLIDAMNKTYNAEFSTAMKMAESYIASNPGDPMGYLVRGNTIDWKQNVLNLRGKLNDQVLNDYEKANKYAFLLHEKDPNNLEKKMTLANTYMFLAKKYLDKGKKTKAGLTLKKGVKHAKEVIEKRPDLVEANLVSGVLNFYADNLPSGLKFLASIIGISGDEREGLNQLNKVATTPNIHQGDAAFVLVHAYGKSKRNYNMALKYANQLFERYSNNPEFLYWIGEMQFRAKRYAESRATFEKLEEMCSKVKCGSNYIFLQHYFATHGYVNSGDLKSAKEHVLKAEKYNKDQYKDRTSYIYYHKGLILAAEGKKSQAKESFDRAIKHKGGNKDAKRLAKKALSGL